MNEGVLRWGVLGSGGIAHDFVSDAHGAGISISAVASRSRLRAAEFAARHQIPAARDSIDALLGDPSIDVVYIATPDPTHAPLALAAIAAGKHVLVEKPFTINHVQALAVADAAEARGVIAQEAMWPRFLPHMQRIRDLVRDGSLGRVQTVSAGFSQRMPDHVRRRMLDPRNGGGALLDLGAYPVSFAWDLLGPPVRIQASSSLGDAGLERRSAIIMDHADGGNSLLHAQLDATGANDAVVIGDRARIEIAPIWFTATEFRLIDLDGRVIEHFVSEVQGRGLHFQALALERAIRLDETATSEMPVRESVAIMRMFDEIREMTR